EGLALRRALFAVGMVDEKARQIEHAGHPRDDRYDMQCLDPEIEVVRSQREEQNGKNGKDEQRSERALSRLAAVRVNLSHQACFLTSFNICSTCSIGVCGVMPCPR